jgi:hypothetical protein
MKIEERREKFKEMRKGKDWGEKERYSENYKVELKLESGVTKEMEKYFI